MLISPAFAQASSGGANTGIGAFLQTFGPIFLIIPIFYFLIIRPQQRRLKDHRELVAAVRRNDTVVTAGGIVGKVTKVVEKEGADAEIEVEIAPNTRVMVVRATIQDVRKAKESE